MKLSYKLTQRSGLFATFRLSLSKRETRVLTPLFVSLASPFPSFHHVPSQIRDGDGKNIYRFQLYPNYFNKNNIIQSKMLCKKCTYPTLFYWL